MINTIKVLFTSFIINQCSYDILTRVVIEVQ